MGPFSSRALRFLRNGFSLHVAASSPATIAWDDDDQSFNGNLKAGAWLRNSSHRMVHDARLPRTSPTDVRLHPPSRTASASMNIPALGDQSLRAPKRRRDAVDAEQLKSSSTQPPYKKTKRYNVSQETDEKPNLEQNLIDNHIYSSHCDLPADRLPPKPDNYNEITERLGEPRASLAPSRFCEDNFDRFVWTNPRALNEDAVMNDVFPAIHGLEALRNLSRVFLPHFAYYPVFFVQQSFAYHLLAGRTLLDIRRGTRSVFSEWPMFVRFTRRS
ncbi:MAG: hypothetical protein Q9225_005259 [Loekoesia sp. 1 TL-2023]